MAMSLWGEGVQGYGLKLICLGVKFINGCLVMIVLIDNLARSRITLETNLSVYLVQDWAN